MEYVFFSGGFDSTAFLLECLFVKKVETTPIVVTDPNLDGKKFHWTGRECLVFEEDARKKVYKFVEQQNDSIKNLLKPEIKIDKVVLTEPMISTSKIAFDKGIFPRLYKQVHYFYQIMSDMGIKGNILGTRDDGTTQEVNKYADKEGYVDSSKLPDYLTFLGLFKVPYLHQSKEEILERAVKYGYDSILYHTWSCWFPSGGQPCGKCEMCNGRIIECKVEISKNFI